MNLLNFPMNDGSRQFFSIPESASWEALRDHVCRLVGVELRNYITDGVTEAWIDFSFLGHDFSINNQFGEYWFFVKDPACPESVLRKVATHCQNISS